MTWFLGAGPALLLAALAVVMVRRKLRTQYPFFFAYLIYQVAITPLLMYFYHRPGDEYFYVYWATAALSPIFGLAVIAEVLRHAFRPFESMQGFTETILRWTAVLGVLCLVIFTLSLNGSAVDRVANVVMVAQRSLRVMQVSLVLLLLLFAGRLGLTFRHHVVAIAAGFGVFAAVDLLIAAVVLRSDPSWFSALSTLKSAAYFGTVGLWAAVLYRPEPERIPEAVPVAPPAEAFSFALPESSLPPPPDSLLLSMEKMVERRLNGHNGQNGKGSSNGHGSGKPHGADPGQGTGRVN
jgi:hypothetical protein